MLPETGIVLAVAAAFLMLGIAISPLAWVAILNRRSQSERRIDARFSELEGRLRALEERVAMCESALLALPGGHDAPEASTRHPRPVRAVVPRGWLRSDRGGALSSGNAGEPRLIAVPNLASAAGDREAMLSGLSQRYAAIWTLADQGASAEVIARATGQPIGQIELILGLRRQIDGTRTTIPHASHE
jgi:hypothetical protein